MRELEHPPLLLLGDARATQEGPRLVRPEVAQGNHTQQVAPPGSRRHAAPGPFLPATTTSARAGSDGTNCSRSQSSSPTAASNVSSSNTAGSPPASASRGSVSAGSPSARPSSAMNAGGEGSIARRSRLTTCTPASSAASAKRAEQRGLADPARTV